jgi:hypothetical protein
MRSRALCRSIESFTRRKCSAGFNLATHWGCHSASLRILQHEHASNKWLTFANQFFRHSSILILSSKHCWINLTRSYRCRVKFSRIWPPITMESKLFRGLHQYIRLHKNVMRTRLERHWKRCRALCENPERILPPPQTSLKSLAT